jgi:hypothetical protein
LLKDIHLPEYTRLEFLQTVQRSRRNMAENSREGFVGLESFQVGPKTLDEARIPYVVLVSVLLICRRCAGDISFGKLWSSALQLRSH